jgi:hypothetical protein
VNCPFRYGLEISLSFLGGNTIGSYTECVSALQSHGIHPGFFPMKEDGNIDKKKYRQWLEKQRIKERRTKPRRKRILVPGRFDVLFGKGWPVQTHIGNVKFRGLVADCRKTYEKTGNGKKHEVIQAVVETVNQSSGLFLKADDDAWIRVGDAAANNKVGAHFRTLRGVHDVKAKSLSRPQSKKA